MAATATTHPGCNHLDKRFIGVSIVFTLHSKISLTTLCVSDYTSFIVLVASSNNIDLASVFATNKGDT